MRSEQTSARVAKIAGRVLATFAKTKCREIAKVNIYDAGETYELADWRDIRALAASALTQAPNVSRTMDRALRRSAKLVAKGKRRARRK